METSLRARLLIVATLLLVIFIGLGIAVLDTSFRRAARSSVQDHLGAQLYALLTAAELSPQGSLYFPERLAEPRFSVAGSGLYAFAYDAAKRQVWQSDSAVSVLPPKTLVLNTGESRFDQEPDAEGGVYFVLRFGVAWDIGDGAQPAYTIVLSEDLTRYRSQVSAFRRSLLLWSGLAALILLVLQLLTLRWALAPLNRVAEEINRVERGEQTTIEGLYPREISGLTRNLNGLIDSSQRALERYRNSLGDLAHSLKTPLAVIRGLGESGYDTETIQTSLREQSQRMADIVDYQLKRAASSGGTGRIGAVAVDPVVRKLTRTLAKVYRDRGIQFDIRIEADAVVLMDQGDLMEVLGNILENACKWCVARVSFSARRDGGSLQVLIGDDGPGVDAGLAEEVLRRGVRADQRQTGQGIGLAVAHEIVSSYQGGISIGRCLLGGAQVELRLPIARKLE